MCIHCSGRRFIEPAPISGRRSARFCRPLENSHQPQARPSAAFDNSSMQASTSSPIRHRGRGLDRLPPPSPPRTLTRPRRIAIGVLAPQLQPAKAILAKASDEDKPDGLSRGTRSHRSSTVTPRAANSTTAMSSVARTALGMATTEFSAGGLPPARIRA